MHVHTYVRHTYVRHTYTSYICTSYIYFKHIMSNGQHLVQECQWRWRIAKISADFCVWEIVLQTRKERERVDYYVSICLTSAIFRLSGHQRENCSLNQNKHELEEMNRRGNRLEWFKVRKDRETNKRMERTDLLVSKKCVQRGLQRNNGFCKYFNSKNFFHQRSNKFWSFLIGFLISLKTYFLAFSYQYYKECNRRKLQPYVEPFRLENCFRH